MRLCTAIGLTGVVALFHIGIALAVAMRMRLSQRSSPSSGGAASRSSPFIFMSLARQIPDR